MSGPAPTPTAVLRLRGSKRAKYRRGGEPLPTGTPVCPAWVRADARAAWKAIVPELEASGVLSRVDVNTLARYCTLWAAWRRDRLDQFLNAELGKLEREFGMTPASRTRIRVEAVKGATIPSDYGASKARFFKGV